MRGVGQIKTIFIGLLFIFYSCGFTGRLAEVYQLDNSNCYNKLDYLYSVDEMPKVLSKIGMIPLC